MPDLSPETIATVTGGPLDRIRAAWPPLLAALRDQGIDSLQVQAGAAATVAVECSTWTPIRERQARPDTPLAAVQARYWPSGYMGRGLIQLTGRGNYDAAGKALGLDLLGQPDLVLDLQVSCRVFAWFFKVSRAAEACESEDWRTCRRRVNGPGMLALDRFQSIATQLLEVANG